MSLAITAPGENRNYLGGIPGDPGVTGEILLEFVLSLMPLGNYRARFSFLLYPVPYIKNKIKTSHGLK